jgi:hypothetical protein
MREALLTRPSGRSASKIGIARSMSSGAPPAISP